MKVVALAGGVGGAKLADGLCHALPPENLTVIVNTGDDFEHWGLHISPDIDTVCYTLAGLANPETGWGLRDETWRTLEAVSRLGGPDWFRIGDTDLATHLERTRRLRGGETLTQITQEFCDALGVMCRVLPMSDDTVATIVESEEGDLPFQEYFVRRRCEPRVKGFHFAGAETARPSPGVIEAIREADAIVICPSNPWVSIDPILAVCSPRSLGIPLASPEGPGLRVIAVSPIIGGKAVKGPAAKMFAELGLEPSPFGVAKHYGAADIHGIVIDNVDGGWSDSIRAIGIQPFVTHTLMTTRADRVHLAQDVLHSIQALAS